MTELVPVIHAVPPPRSSRCVATTRIARQTLGFAQPFSKPRRVDARHKAGHDGEERHPPQLHPVVPPHVSHFRQVPLRTMVKLPHSGQASPT